VRSRRWLPQPQHGREWVVALRQGLRRELPEYMAPIAIVVLPALPLGPTGKADAGSIASLTTGQSEPAWRTQGEGERVAHAAGRQGEREEEREATSRLQEHKRQRVRRGAGREGRLRGPHQTGGVMRLWRRTAHSRR